MSREPEPSWRDGMRSLHPDEFGSLCDLVHTVFRPGLADEYPHFYTPAHAGEMRVVVADGRVVSHIGALRRNVSIFGCTVRTSSLGGVATYEEHRGNGYATALFEDTMRVCREDGVDFMLVSGYRKMYHRFGCRYVGRDWNFSISAERAGDFDDDGVELVAASRDDVPAMASVYREEPVRWMRPPSDYSHAFNGFVMNRPALVFKVCEAGMMRGYMIVQEPREGDDRIPVQEAAGDRRCLTGALGKLIRTLDLQAIGLHVMGCDRLFHECLQSRGITGAPANSSGTVTLINFVQFMERMRPYFAEVIGESEARSLVFREDGDEMTFTYGGDQVVAPDQGAAVQLIFGTLEGAEEALLKSGGRAGEILAEVFPIPALWYGVNYL